VVLILERFGGSGCGSSLWRPICHFCHVEFSSKVMKPNSMDQGDSIALS
jgi:hypothetical protein